MRKIIATLCLALLTIIAHAPAAVPTTLSTTRPIAVATTEATINKPITVPDGVTVYNGMSPANGHVFSRDETGYAPAQGYVPGVNAPAYLAYAKANGGLVYIDREDCPSRIGFAKRPDFTVVLWTAKYAQEIQRCHEADPSRLVGIFTDPIGGGWQYGTDQAQFVADNVAYAKLLDPFPWDRLCIPAYVSIDDRTMSPATFRQSLLAKAKAGKLWGRRIVFFDLPYYVKPAGQPAERLPSELRQVIYDVAGEVHADVCLWGGAADAVEAKTVLGVLKKAA